MDFDAVTVYVGIFRNGGAVHSHAHEDMLSYAVYLGVAEALIDPGRPSYLPSDAGFVAATAHNGLADAEWPVRPRLRFFSNHALRREPCDCGITRADDGAVSLWAENRLFGLRRELTIRRQGANTIHAEERLSATRILAPRFTHNFPGLEAEKSGDATVHLAEPGLEIAYEGVRVEIESAERARDYGSRLPIRRVRATLLPAREAQVAWTLRRLD